MTTVETGCSEDLPRSPRRIPFVRFAGSCFCGKTRRKKDGKTHSYWSVVENQRLEGGRVVQRHVLYLREISPSQAAAWRKSIEVFDEDAGQSRTLALFPEDHCSAVTPDSSIVQLR